MYYQWSPKVPLRATLFLRNIFLRKILQREGSRLGPSRITLDPKMLAGLLPLLAPHTAEGFQATVRGAALDSAEPARPGAHAGEDAGGRVKRNTRRTKNRAEPKGSHFQSSKF